MSGHKHALVTIRQDEYRRLHEAEMKLREEQNKANSNAQYTKTLLTAYQELEDRQEEYETLLETLGNDVIELETEISRNILRRQAEYYQDLLDQFRDIQDDMDFNQELLLETTQSFEQVIQQERENNQQLFDSFYQSVTNLEENQFHKESITQQWISDCLQISYFIDEHYDHKKFYPSEFTKITKRLDMAINNFNQGLVEGGMQFAQEAYIEFSDLKVSLEEKTSEWQAIFHLVNDQLQNLQKTFLKSSSVRAIGIDGEFLDEVIDLNYWSGGKYDGITTNISETLIYLKEMKQNIDFDYLLNLSTQIIPKFEIDFNELVFEARKNVINSQIKNNIAYIATKALETHGFSLQNAGYSNDDMKDAFFAQLSGLDGSSVILQVSPSSDDTDSNVLSIETNDETVQTEHELMLRWIDINKALEQFGINVGKVHIDPNNNKLFTNTRADKDRVRRIKKHNQDYHHVQTNRE